ncbi:MAG: patatin-like phospholipase family protein [Gammaproteobacteria bacterium]|nr:patatin-like phospholipase family protein [Gammaproteobacteria bacterium]MDP6733404.1 patatin-like phospholipase family protein [Gammaproteobacteria bacterium]
MTDPQKRPIGLILSGGGSRAAYQIGVLRVVANILPKHYSNPFDVISGTSAGALNAASLATHAQRLRTGVRTLEYIWKNISSEQIYDPQSGNLLSSASSVLLTMLGSKSNGGSRVALLNNSPLGDLLRRVIKFERIQRNIDIGLLDAVSVTASAYSTGESVSFYQAVRGIEDWQGPHRIGIRTELGLAHLMASTAIPVIFPAVQIDKQFFGDGAIRQLAPTSTAIHLGARRILAIGVSGNRTQSPLEDELTEQPSLSQIIGHILNSAFVDTLENDLEFLRHVNEVIPHVSKRAIRNNDIELTEVELLEISPSKQLNLLAMEYYDELPKPMSRYIKEESSGTMLSLILFEKGFCTALWQLGFDDAMAKEAEIRQFFGC